MNKNNIHAGQCGQWYPEVRPRPDAAATCGASLAWHTWACQI